LVPGFNPGLALRTTGPHGGDAPEIFRTHGSASGFLHIFLSAATLPGRIRLASLTSQPRGTGANQIRKKGSPGMRVQRIVLSLAISISGGIAAQTSAFSEEYRGSWEQQMACTPDVMRLCSDQIPDVNRIVACLRQNTALLGNSCRAVFESNASAAQQAAPRGRVVRPKSDDDDE
jgi:hypothetical protein